MNPDVRVRVRDGWREALWAFLGARGLLTAISVIGGGMLALPAGQPPTDAGFPNPKLHIPHSIRRHLPRLFMGQRPIIAMMLPARVGSQP